MTYAEQETSTTIVFSSTSRLKIRIRIAIRSSEGEGEGTVSTELTYEPELPRDSWELQDILHRYIYDAVHSGLAMTRTPLPANGIHVNVSKLDIEPIKFLSNEIDLERVGAVLAEWSPTTLRGYTLRFLQMYKMTPLASTQLSNDRSVASERTRGSE